MNARESLMEIRPLGFRRIMEKVLKKRALLCVYVIQILNFID